MAELREGLNRVLSVSDWIIAAEKSNAKSGDAYYAVNTKTGEEVYKGRYNDSVEAVRVISTEIINGTARDAGKFVAPTVGGGRREPVSYIKNHKNSDMEI